MDLDGVDDVGKARGGSGGGDVVSSNYVGGHATVGVLLLGEHDVKTSAIREDVAAVLYL